MDALPRDEVVADLADGLTTAFPAVANVIGKAGVPNGILAKGRFGHAARSAERLDLGQKVGMGVVCHAATLGCFQPCRNGKLPIRSSLPR